MLPSVTPSWRSESSANSRSDKGGLRRILLGKAEPRKPKSDTGVVFLEEDRTSSRLPHQPYADSVTNPNNGRRGRPRRSAPPLSCDDHLQQKPERSAQSVTFSRDRPRADRGEPAESPKAKTAGNVQFLSPSRTKPQRDRHGATKRQAEQLPGEDYAPVPSGSSVPELPNIGSKPSKLGVAPGAKGKHQSGSGSGSPLAKNGDPSARSIRIGAHNQHVQVYDIKQLRLYFDSIDVDGNGLVSFSKLQAGLAVFSQKTNMTGHAKMLHKRGSMSKRVQEGLFSFTDVLRIIYPAATNKNIADMVLISRKERGEKLEAHQFPKWKQKEAERFFYRVCDDAGKVSLDQLESFLHENFPDVDQYKALSIMPKDNVDDLYEGQSIAHGDFILWYLKFDEQRNGEAEIDGAGRRRPAGKANQLRQKNASHQDILSSYISKRSMLPL